MDTHEKTVLADIADKAYKNKSEDRKRKKTQDKYLLPISEDSRKQWTFYCVYCRQDFIAIGYKQVNLLNIAEVFYKTVHECGKDCIRRWTERIDDEYYNLSEDIRRERNAFQDDMLSPNQNRFKILYEDTADLNAEERLRRLEESVYAKHRVEGARSSKSQELKNIKYAYV